MTERKQSMRRKPRFKAGVPWNKPMSDAEYIERLKSRCVISESDCWLYQGTLGWKGYGQISYRNKQWGTHRLSYTLHIGPIPKGLHVCHTCDVRNCCNPDHLWLGTDKDNMQDASRKGRVNWIGLRMWNEQKQRERAAAKE